jgi:hypothetical protein
MEGMSISVSVAGGLCGEREKKGTCSQNVT